MISFRKLSVERLLQGRRVFPWGTRKLIQLCVNCGFGLVYVYNADEMQQLSRPPDPIFYLPHVLQ